MNPDIDRVLESLEGDCQALAQLWSPITPACAQPSRSVEEVMQKIHTCPCCIDGLLPYWFTSPTAFEFSQLAIMQIPTGFEEREVNELAG